MKIKLALIIIISVLLLTGCTKKINEEIGYALTKINDDECATALEVVYTDEEYEYGFGCLESDRYIISDENGNEYTIYEVIDDGLLTIEEIYELFDGHLYRTEIINVSVIESEIKYFDFNTDNLVIANTLVRIDESGYRNWPFDGNPEIVELEIDYTDVLDELKIIMSSIEGREVCDFRSIGCVMYGPMPAFDITITDGVNTYTLSLEVSDFDGGQRISHININEGQSTLTTINSIELLDEFDALYTLIDEVYQSYLCNEE